MIVNQVFHIVILIPVEHSNPVAHEQSYGDFI